MGCRKLPDMDEHDIELQCQWRICRFFSEELCWPYNTQAQKTKVIREQLIVYEL